MRRAASPTTGTGAAGSSMRTSCARASATPRVESRAAETTVRRSSRSVFRSSLPVAMRDTSSRSSISRTSCPLCRSIIDSVSASRTSKPEPRAISCRPLRIAASGLRSSCASVARKVSLRRSASRSACSAASWRPIWSRIWYWRRRARRADCTALTIVRDDDGKSSSVRLLSCASIRCSSTARAPSRPRESTITGRSDHGGCASSAAIRRVMRGSVTATSVITTAAGAARDLGLEAAEVGARRAVDPGGAEQPARDVGVAPCRREDQDPLVERRRRGCFGAVAVVARRVSHRRRPPAPAVRRARP